MYLWEENLRLLKCHLHSLSLFTDDQENVFDRDEDDQQWMNRVGLCFHSSPREMIEQFAWRWMEKTLSILLHGVDKSDTGVGV